MANEVPNKYSDPYWTDLAANTETKLGLPAGLLVSVLTKGERSNNDQVSEAGAKTPFQITPKTRFQAVKKYGIDAYLSPENAAEVAGLLLKDSLDRNKGDVSAAVGEYHGGTNRDNWGAKTNAYIKRVLGGTESINLDSLQSGFANWLKQNPAIPEAKTAEVKAPTKAEDSLNVGFGQWLKTQSGTLADQIPGPNGEQIISKPQQPTQEPGLLDKAVGVGEAALNVGTGLAAAIPGVIEAGNKAIYKATQGELIKPPELEAAAIEGMTPYTYQPRSATGREIAGGAGEFLQNAIPLVAVGPELAAIQQAAKPAIVQATQAVRQGAAKLPKVSSGLMEKIPGMPTETPPAASPSAMRSVGAAGAVPSAVARATVANSSPELIAEVDKLIKKKEPINQKALENQVMGESLPVPVRFTAGQAAEDAILISQERNNRAKQPEYIERANANNAALIENLNAIKDRAAPDIFHLDKVEHNDALIKLYENLDDALRTDITTKYDALRNANGGDFPLNTEAFVNNAEALLKEQNLNHWLSGEVKSLLETYKQAGSMTFNQFETLRTILADEIRTEANGNRRKAARFVRQALEDIPLTKETEALKPLADAARSAAKNRFDMLSADPAYKAVVEGKASADNFINKFVINSTTEKLQTMLQHLGQDDIARQTVASALIGYLRQNARVSESGGNFAAASYNNALAKLGPKIETVFDAESAKNLNTVGRASQLLAQQPSGSFVNNPNTAVALIGNIAEKVPGIRTAKELVQKAKEQKQVDKSLRVGAGITQKESKLLEVRRKVEAKKAAKAAKQ